MSLKLVNTTLSLDLSYSWASKDAIFKSTPKTAPIKSNQVLWTDVPGNAFYTFGGMSWLGINMTDTEVWKFQADGSGGGQWSIVTASNPEVFKGLRQTEHASVAFTNDTGFAIGGLATGWTEKDRSTTQVVPGIMSLSFRNSAFQNGTAPAGSPFETLVGGQARWVPGFGPNGLIVLLGGVTPPFGSYKSIAASAPVDFANLTFFDPVTREVYAQKATGDIPPSPRVNFCNVAFRNPNNGGYDIFVFGGSNERDGFGYDDAYILSLPGFVWTKVPSSPAGQRYQHACVGVGNRQVLVIGGGGEGGMMKSVDPAPQGLHLFDMTTLSWRYSYEADDAPYEPAASIKAWYANGSLDSVKWSSPRVQALFVNGASATSTFPPGSSRTGSAQEGLGSDEGSKSGDSSSATPIGAIVGGVVGGVALLSIIALVAFIMIRKSRREQAEKPKEQSELPPSYQDTPDASEYAEAPGIEAYKYGYAAEARGNRPVIHQADSRDVSYQPSEVDGGHGYVEVHGLSKPQAVSVGVAPIELDAGSITRHQT